jgi:SAM-dependent methyltransferase
MAPSDRDEAALVELSKSRWRGQEPEAGLTWGRIWDGSAFIWATQERCRFLPSLSILEVGPGYGRLLDQILHDQLPFASYLGLELSPGRVERLSAKYRADRRITFLCGDVETADLGRRFDLCISSATFSHLYPSCAKALQNIERHLHAGSFLMFDVQGGGPDHGFQEDGRTFGRAYSMDELKNLIAGTRFGEMTSREITHGISAQGVAIVYLFVALRVSLAAA